MERTLVWAHRGASGYAPENTLIAFEKAVEMGDAMHPALYNLQYPGFRKDCKKHGKRVHTWTVNEEQYMRMVCEMQVDAMITDYPDLGRKIAKEYMDGKLTPELVLEIRDRELRA